MLLLMLLDFIFLMSYVQPVNLNLDEETLMKVVAFWRSSLSTSTQSSQYYFDNFEIHPIKVCSNRLLFFQFLLYAMFKNTTSASHLFD